ncbi:MAG: UTP-glucose-1-phosphate uridylyltransferase [Candidatus Woesebacteria bacterium GW2011_GWC1_38_13]|uniref:UTP--glucose-1-phosphate uridylyltransferase n=3 Tax=Candidatus Woeseibacteriota TaxID=1752722 RepID=A0A0G0KYN7_9BACT|nr:MAG: UTP-glucose-1-phosphate uridylyltransferase [Candidatus Woesebacteria bacterium GW2011_GWD1_38_10]KKQ56230.1 MAG: UTP-glucose-1-phosphate uridylyltransferase [Candidatus Woesebacteria bacterium GW2011_GWC1_38_13]KKQ84783.1 MAG: UTP-glucose-1-phosphate uridylyltransferase [Candidatus Woesebacteria bacterium GW2011_GWA1_38_8]
MWYNLHTVKTNRRKIKKAIIAAAGYGTRFLPATKNQPKEMLPIIDKPIIHHLVEECVSSGITDIIIVTRSGQGIMEDYFDSSLELEYMLDKNGKDDLLKKVRDIPQMANFVYVRQKKNLPYGNGTPLLVAAPLIDNYESVVYMFGDDLTISKKPVTRQLIDVFYNNSPSAVLAVQEVPDIDVERYGTVKYKNKEKNYEISTILEKMPLGKNPSNMAQFGRFVFSYDVIKEVKNTSTGKDNELWITDVLNNLAQSGKKVIAQPIEGKWLTTGDPLRYMQTQVLFALERSDIGKDFSEFLKNLDQS